VKVASSWEARLHLTVERRDSRSALTRRSHVGPLVVQKPFYPEGDECVHLIVVHPPGGIAEGDKLEIKVDVGATASALLTTPGAAKWYRCTQTPAEQHAQFHVAAGGALEWLPQETIFFDASQSRLSMQVELEADAIFAGWDIFCFGRSASGERFRTGYFDQRTEIRRDGKTIWYESGQLRGDDPLMNSPLGLAGFPICGAFFVAAPGLKRLPLTALREITAGSDSRCGVTLLPQIFVARYLGQSAEEAKAYFAKLWALLRPVLNGREVSLPRIWRT